MMKNLLTICFCWFALSVWGQQDTTFLYMDSLFQQLPEVLVRGERPVIKAEKGKLAQFENLGELVKNTIFVA